MDYAEVFSNWRHRLAEEDDASSALRDIVESVPSIDLPQIMEAMGNRYGHENLNIVQNLVFGPIGYLFSLNEDEDVFYRKLWSLLQNDELFCSDELRELAIGVSVCCNGMPYRKAQTVTMDETEYGERVQKLADASHDILGMMGRYFSQKTERGAAVLALINAYNDERDRAVLMGLLLESMSHK